MDLFEKIKISCRNQDYNFSGLSYAVCQCGNWRSQVRDSKSSALLSISYSLSPITYHLSPITYNTPLPHPSDPTDPTDPSDSPETTDPFRSLICPKIYPRRHAATRSITSPDYHTLSANVEIGVPRSDSQRLSGFPEALLVRDCRKTVCRIENPTIS